MYIQAIYFEYIRFVICNNYKFNFKQSSNVDDMSSGLDDDDNDYNVKYTMPELLRNIKTMETEISVLQRARLTPEDQLIKSE